MNHVDLAASIAALFEPLDLTFGEVVELGTVVDVATPQELTQITTVFCDTSYLQGMASSWQDLASGFGAIFFPSAITSLLGRGEMTRCMKTAAERVTYEVDHEVWQLADDDVDATMEGLVKRLRARDSKLASDLSLVGLGIATSDVDVRALALETLSVARVPDFESILLQTILRLLNSDEEQLRFAAVAAVSELSYPNQVSITGTIRRMASEDVSSGVRAAAAVFASHVERSR